MHICSLCTYAHMHICTMHDCMRYGPPPQYTSMHVCAMARPRNTHRTRAGLGAWRRLKWIGGGRIRAHVALTVRKMVRTGEVFVPPI